MTGCLRVKWKWDYLLAVKAAAASLSFKTQNTVDLQN